MADVIAWSTSVLASLALFVLLPMGLGLIFFNRGVQDRGITYIFGLFLELSVFELIYLPFVFGGWSFSLLTAVFFVIVTAGALAGFLLWYKRRPLYSVNKTPLSKKEKTALIIAAVVIGYQLLRVTVGAGTWNIDDGWYLSIANSAIESDAILRCDVVTGEPYDFSQNIIYNTDYIFSPWPLFWAMTAKLTWMDITVLMRTVMPAPFILLFYYVVYRLISFIYRNDREKALTALAVFAVFYELTAVAMNVRPTWILCYPWMGKGFGPSIICPAVLLMFLLLEEERQKEKRRLLWFGIFLGNIAGCVTASSCAELNLLMLGAWGLVHIIRRRDFSVIWKLALCVSPSILLISGHLIMTSSLFHNVP